MKPIAIAIAVLAFAGSAFPQLPSHLKNKPPILISGTVTNITGGKLIVDCWQKVTTQNPGSTSFYRGSDGKMKSKYIPGGTTTRDVLVRYEVMGYPALRDVNIGDKANFPVVEHSVVVGVHKVYYVGALVSPKKKPQQVLR